VLSSFVHQSIGVPPQFASENPCPLYAGCNQLNNYIWLAPDYPEYRDVNFPQLGEWPPPQPGPAYDTWASEQKRWSPYRAIAYNGTQPGDACNPYSLGAPQVENMTQALFFDFAASPDWPFITSWTGIKVGALISKHSYVTNEGSCNVFGPMTFAIWIGKAAADYPFVPATWAAGQSTLQQSYEFNDFGLGDYSNPYGAGTLLINLDCTIAPPGGWLTAEVKRYWVLITCWISGQGHPDGRNNSNIALRKIWAGAIATLGGSPPSSSPNTAHISVQG